MEQPRKPIKRRWKVMLVALVLLLVLPCWPAWLAFITDFDTRETYEQGTFTDASRLEVARMERVALPADPDEAVELLRQTLAKARDAGRTISVGGTRHSMGGQSLQADGILVDTSLLAHMELDATKSVLAVGSGARWDAVIEYLNQHGRAVAVMQSNSSFSVGGSISVNCHGWTYGRAPIADTVESFVIMTADGKLLRCSRRANPELFSLVLGGYGLFGVILSAELRVVPNERYLLEQFAVSAGEAIALYEEKVAQPDVAMAYGRMRIDANHFLEEVIINVLRRSDEPLGEPIALKPPSLVAIRRSLFRGSVGSNYGKQLRWWAETQVEPRIRAQEILRNDLMNEPTQVFENRKSGNTDILHEYFIPEDQVGFFVAALRSIIPDHKGNLLNVTIRHVSEDTDSFLRYADQPMFAFVMLFNQQRTPSAEEQMQHMTEALIDAALDAGGRYYLPYRLHATPEQFHRAYPMAEAFFDAKARYDPQARFKNRFYARYSGR